MKRVEIYLKESEYKILKEICEEEGYDIIDECVAWAVEELLNMYMRDRDHTGSISSSVSSDNLNHPKSIQ